MAPQSTDSTIERRVSLPAPVDAVWEAITDPSQLSLWFGGHVELDPHIGGRAVFTDDRSGLVRHGVVHDVEPGHRLVFRWWPAGPDGQGSPADAASTVELVVEEDGEGAALTVTEKLAQPTWFASTGAEGPGGACLNMAAAPSRA